MRCEFTFAARNCGPRFLSADRCTSSVAALAVAILYAVHASRSAAMAGAFRENGQRVWHVDPTYTESIYSTVMSGTILVRATETSFGIDVSRDGPLP